MKILMINSCCGVKSTGRICTDLADALTELGHEVKIAYGRENVPDKYKKYGVRIGSDFDVKLHALQARLFDNDGFGSKDVTKRFIEWVKIYDPDVIHLHNLHGYYINVEVLFDYLAKSNKKIIWTLHDCWAFTGHCTYFSYVKCSKWKHGCKNCPQKNEYPSSILIDRSHSNWEKKKKLFSSVKNLTIVTPSKWLANLVRKSFLSNSRIVVINNGIDTEIFKPVDFSRIKKRLKLSNKKILLGVAAVWNKRKGLEDFVKLNQVIDREKYQIILVGLSKKQIESLPSEIIGITRTDSTEELAELYSMAYIFINPTYEDNFPTTNLEAQACGTPVITYKTGGSIESVPLDNYVEPGNIRAVLEKLELENGVNREILTKKDCVKKYTDLYNEK